MSSDYRLDFRAQDPILQHDINLARIELNDSAATPLLETVPEYRRSTHLTKIGGLWMRYEWQEQLSYLNLIMKVTNQPPMTHVDCLDAEHWSPESANIEMARFGCDSRREEGLAILTHLIADLQPFRPIATLEVDGETFFETPLGHWVKQTTTGIRICNYGGGGSHTITNIRVRGCSHAYNTRSYSRLVCGLAEKFDRIQALHSTQVITFVGEEYHTSQDTQIHLHRCSDGTIKEYDPSRGNLVVWKPVPSHPQASISHRVAAMHGYDKAEFERSSRQLAF